MEHSAWGQLPSGDQFLVGQCVYDPREERELAGDDLEKQILINNIPTIIATVTGYFCKVCGVYTLEERMPGGIMDINDINLSSLRPAWEGIFRRILPFRYGYEFSATRPGEDLQWYVNGRSARKLTIVGYPGTTKTTFAEQLFRSFHCFHLIEEDCPRFLTPCLISSIFSIRKGIEHGKDVAFSKSFTHLWNILKEQVALYFYDAWLSHFSRLSGFPIYPINMGGIPMAFVSFCAYAGVEALPKEALEFIRIFSESSEVVVSMIAQEADIRYLVGQNEGLLKRSNLLERYDCMAGMYRQLQKVFGYFPFNLVLKGKDTGACINQYHEGMKSFLCTDQLSQEPIPLNICEIARNMRENFPYIRKSIVIGPDEQILCYLSYLPESVLALSIQSISEVEQYFRDALEKWYACPLFEDSSRPKGVPVEELMDDLWQWKRRLEINSFFLGQGHNDSTVHLFLSYDDALYLGKRMWFIRNLLVNSLKDR